MIAVLLNLLLAALCYSTTTTDFEDPWTPDPDCPFPAPNQTIYFPVPGDCAKYIVCFEGTKYEEECQDGLWWNQLIESCDYPGGFCPDGTTPLTGTSTTTTSTTITTTTTEPTTTTTSTSPSTTTPTTTTSTTTPTTTTTSTTTPTTTTTSTTTNPSIDPRCSDMTTSYWPHPVECRLYIECYEGNSYEMACPRGLYFSHTVSMCVDASQSACCLVDPSKC